MRLLMHKNDKNFSYLRELQYNINRPNDWAFEQAEKALIDAQRHIERSDYYFMRDLDWKELDILAMRDKDAYDKKFKEVKERKPFVPTPYIPTTEEKQDWIKKNVPMVRVTEWKYLGDGYFEVFGEEL